MASELADENGFAGLIQLLCSKYILWNLLTDLQLNPSPCVAVLLKFLRKCCIPNAAMTRLPLICEGRQEFPGKEKLSSSISPFFLAPHFPPNAPAIAAECMRHELTGGEQRDTDHQSNRLQIKASSVPGHWKNQLFICQMYLVPLLPNAHPRYQHLVYVMKTVRCFPCISFSIAAANTLNKHKAYKKRKNPMKATCWLWVQVKKYRFGGQKRDETQCLQGN